MDLNICYLTFVWFITFEDILPIYFPLADRLNYIIYKTAEELWPGLREELFGFSEPGRFQWKNIHTSKNFFCPKNMSIDSSRKWGLWRTKVGFVWWKWFIKAYWGEKGGNKCELIEEGVLWRDGRMCLEQALSCEMAVWTCLLSQETCDGKRSYAKNLWINMCGCVNHERFVHTAPTKQVIK